MGGRILQIKAEYFILEDKFIVVEALKSTSNKSSIKIPGGAPDLLAVPFLKGCKSLIDECQATNLPKLAVEVTLFYASIARSFEAYCRSVKKNLEKATDHSAVAKQLLEEAREICTQPFQNAERLQSAVEEC